MKELFKKPETLKEKLEDLWYDLSYYYPREIKYRWWAVKRFFKNLWRYRNILASDNDFDNSYLETVLLEKLKWMADYFRTARIVEGEERIYHEINLAIKLGELAFDRELEEDESSRYINTKNYKKFLKNYKFGQNELTDSYFKKELRRKKAMNLFYRVLAQYSGSWWD